MRGIFRSYSVWWRGGGRLLAWGKGKVSLWGLDKTSLLKSTLVCARVATTLQFLSGSIDYRIVGNMFVFHVIKAIVDNVI